MITKLGLQNFKKWRNKTFDLKKNGVTIIAGGNNSGKSSILHAFAIWEFCKTYILFEKGQLALLNGYTGQGVGINYNDFSPVNIPNLKYLWTNLKPSSGYNLKIKLYWDEEIGESKFLEFGLALANERLFIKSTDSNLDELSFIPNIAYLPPFAGISENEPFYSPADRRKMIGKGLAGAILRNTIIDMFNENSRKRIEAKGERTKIPARALREIRNTDPYFLLNKALHSSFGSWLFPEPFNPTYHSYIKIETAKGNYDGSRFRKHTGYNKRDIMVEGSGFLQWLSVYAFALDSNINMLLLDEPDAHLHSSLQSTLLDELEEISLNNGKQIFLASHSTEIISHIKADSILEVNAGSNQRYLIDDRQKINLMSGLGSEYSPIINKLQKSKRLLFVENNSDAKILKSVCSVLELEWPENIVIWPIASRHDARKQLIIRLKDEIQGLSAFSLIDRDREEINTTAESLRDGTFNYNDLQEDSNILLRYRKWRRRHIESYLIVPSVVARISDKTEQEIRTIIENNHALIIPNDYAQSNHSPTLDAIFHCDGKAILETISKETGVNKFDIAQNLVQNEVCEDLRTFVTELVTEFLD